MKTMCSIEHVEDIVSYLNRYLTKFITFCKVKLLNNPHWYSCSQGFALCCCFGERCCVKEEQNYLVGSSVSLGNPSRLS